MTLSGSTQPGSSHAPLISAESLAKMLDQPTLRLFDVRGKWGKPALHEEYLASHIRGACFLDWTRHFVEQDLPIGLAPVCDAEAARHSFAELGIDPGDTVVLYDDYFHMLAGRMWWAMRHWGFEDVRVLDGGWRRWRDLGLPTSSGPSAPQQPGSYLPSPASQPVRIELDDLVAEAQGICHLDARGAKGYAGTADDPRSGHIPGAVNLPYSELLDPETGLFLEPEALRQLFDRTVPGWTEKPMVTSCGAGYAATVHMLAFHTLGTVPRMFDGSFSEWKQDPSRPVEQATPPQSAYSKNR